jgi:hypothetical protein
LPRLSEDKITEMTELFNLYDREGTGKLSLEEFEQALQSTWEDMPSSQEVQSDFNSADSGSKGYITLQDFINWLQKTMWVDFQDLAKGASHGYSKFSSKAKGNRRDGLLGFVSDKTLVEITAKKIGRNSRPNFANEFAAQQARYSRCAPKSIHRRQDGRDAESTNWPCVAPTGFHSTSTISVCDSHVGCIILPLVSNHECDKPPRP